MNVKIWPRASTDRGGYACMQMKKNISVGKSDWILETCPECGRECWITPLLKTALSQGAVALCTECAIRKVLKNSMRYKMTEIEAIKELRNIRPKYGIIPQKRAEAIDIAIEVLEKAEKYHWHDLRKNPEDLPKNLSGSYLFENKWGQVFKGTFRAVGDIKLFETHIYSKEHGGDIWLQYKTCNVVWWKEIEPFEED